MELLNFINENPLIVSSILPYLKEEDMLPVYQSFPMLKKSLRESYFPCIRDLTLKGIRTFVNCYSFVPVLHLGDTLIDVFTRNCQFEYLEDPMILVEFFLNERKVLPFKLDFPDSVASFKNNCLYVEIFSKRDTTLSSKIVSLVTVIRVLTTDRVTIKSNLSTIPVSIMNLFDEIVIIPDYDSSQGIVIDNIPFDNPKLKEINFGRYNIEGPLERIDILYDCFKECEKRGIRIGDCPSKEEDQVSYFTRVSDKYLCYEDKRDFVIELDIADEKRFVSQGQMPIFKIVGSRHLQLTGQGNKEVWVLNPLTKKEEYVFSVMKIEYEYKLDITL